MSWDGLGVTADNSAIIITHNRHTTTQRVLDFKIPMSQTVMITPATVLVFVILAGAVDKALVNLTITIIIDSVTNFGHHRGWIALIPLKPVGTYRHTLL